MMSFGMLSAAWNKAFWGNTIYKDCWVIYSERM